MWPRRPADLRSRLRSDEGTSYLEVAVVVGLMGIVATVLISFLTSSQTNLERQTARTISNDEVRLAVESFDREVRSGNVVYNPGPSEAYAAGDVAAGMSIRVYAQTNGNPRCVQWRITSDAELQRRTWPAYFDPNNPTHQALVSAWRTVATDIRNRDEGIAAFERPETNIVIIRLRVNSDRTGGKGSTVEVSQSVSGRNTLRFPTGSATEVCGPATPDPALAGAGRVPAYA